MASDSRVRVALYLRVSTRDQRPDLQLDELRQHAEQRGWTIVGEFIDHGESSVKDSRPQLDEAMKLIRRGGIDVLLVWRFDRFARSVRHLVLTLDELRSRNVEFTSLRDGIDTSTPGGRLHFHVVAAVAEFEHALIRERTVAGVAAARRRGAKLGRPKAHLDVFTAVRLRKQGLSLRQIAKKMGASYGVVQRAIRDADLDGSESSDAGSD